MTPADIAQSIPKTAWEQAVFVVLFVIVIALVGVFAYKLLTKTQEFFRSEREELQRFFREQREQDKQEKEELKEGMTGMTLVVKELVGVVTGMDKRLEAHDQMERGLISAWASAQVNASVDKRQKTQPRKKKAGENGADPGI